MCAGAGGDNNRKFTKMLTLSQLKTQTRASLATYVLESMFRKTYTCTCTFTCAMDYKWIENVMATVWALRLLFPAPYCVDLSTL